MWQALVTLGGEELVAVADVVPVDQFLEWYPGWTPELIDSPWVAEPPGPFTKAGEARFWFADFHWPRGFSPLAFVFVTDCSAWGTQSAAHWLPLPAGRGLGVRLGGPFPYASELPETSEWEVGFRAARLERTLPRFLDDFEATWEERKWELQLALGLLRVVRLRRPFARRHRCRKSSNLVSQSDALPPVRLENRRHRRHEPAGVD